MKARKSKLTGKTKDAKLFFLCRLFRARESSFAPNLTSADVMQITDPFHSGLFHFIIVFLAVSER